MTEAESTTMQSLIMLMLFVGMLMIVHGVYEQRLKALEKNKQVEYRFIPRTYYDEQLAESTVTKTFKRMFDRESPWSDRNTGVSI
jgi:hypothetical protein